MDQQAPLHGNFDWTSGPLAEGLACYRAEEFFLAHEHWEFVWLRLQEPEKSFLQALIQLTAAFHHLHRGNIRGAASLLRKSSARLERCPSEFAGILTGSLCHDLRALLLLLECGAASPSAPAILPAAGASHSTRL